MKSWFEPQPLPGSTSAPFVPRPSLDAAAAPDPGEAAPVPPELAEPEPPAEPEPDPVAEAVEAHAAARQALTAAAAAFERSIDDARRSLQAERREWLAGAIELAFALAARILERRLALEPDALHGLVARAALLLGTGASLEVAVDPETHERLQAELPEPLASLQQGHDVAFVPDASLGSGELQLRAGDARVEVVIASLLECLGEELSDDWLLPVADADGDGAQEGLR